MIEKLIPSLALSGIFIALFLLCFFSAPITDESLPIAIALRFLQGQKPFIDDLSPYIGLGFFVAPFVKLSIIIHNGKDDLILFLRHAYLFFSILVGLYTYLATRKYLPDILASVIAISIIIFHPFGINNFHYDTLVTLLLSALIFQLYNFIFSSNNSTLDYLLFALLNVMLCLSYPTFLLLVVLLNTIGGFFINNKKTFYLSQTAVYLFTATLMAWLIFAFYSIQLADLMNALEFNKNLAHFSAHQHSFIGKTLIVISNLIKRYAIHFTLAVILLKMAYHFKNSRTIQNSIFLIMLIVPLFFIQVLHPSFTGIFYYLTGLGLTGVIIFFIYLKQNTVAKNIFFSIWIPSFAAGLLTSISSYNLELNFIIGFFPAVLSSVIFYCLALEKINENQSSIPKIFILFFISLLCYFQLCYLYGDDIRGLKIYTTHQQYHVKGPLNHLYIEPKWIPILSSLQKDLQAIDTSDSTFIYFGTFSVGYLFLDKLKPGDYLAYCPYEVDHFGQKVRTPNYTVDLSRSLNIPESSIRTYLSQQTYTKFASRPLYDIYYNK